MKVSQKKLKHYSLLFLGNRTQELEQESISYQVEARSLQRSFNRVEEENKRLKELLEFESYTTSQPVNEKNTERYLVIDYYNNYKIRTPS